MIERRHFLAGGGALAGAALVSLSACSSDDATEPATTSTTEAASSPADPDRQLPAAFTPILIATVGRETAPVRTSDGRWRVLYELVLTNAQPAPATIERIDVVDADDIESTVQTYEGADLLDALQTISGSDLTEPEIAPDASLLMLVELVFDEVDEVPDAVAHRFVGTASATPRSPEPQPVDYVATPFELSTRTAATIAAPLRGGRWLAVNGLDSKSGVHRGAIQSIDGSLFDAQRFAIDWMLLSDDDMLAVGDPGDLDNYPSYGQDVLAVADGTVVRVVDDLDDQVPGTLPAPGSITLETVDGNHVILEVGDGVYAFYAHLQKGSIEVAEGDTVAAGDVLGLLGNSGNTSGPHLHLHLMTKPNPLGADSIPYVFESFTSDGHIADEEWASAEGIEGPWTVLDPGEQAHTDELPLGLTVISF